MERISFYETNDKIDTTQLDSVFKMPSVCYYEKYVFDKIRNVNNIISCKPYQFYHSFL